MKEMEQNPSIVGLAYEDIYFTTSDKVVLNGWFIPAQNAKGTVIFFHGNAGNISHRLEKISVFNRLGYNLFIFDYRGYGKSKGRPGEKGFYKDAEAAYRYLVKEQNVSADNIILYGESIGGAVAIDLASKTRIKALITEGTLSSVKDMIRIVYPFLPYFILESRLDSASKIKDIQAPKLIMHSVDDEIIPYKLGEKLFSAAPPPKKFLKLRGGHNTAFQDSRDLFIAGLRDFLR
jgi:fermentation-respiration switch protein FrsA (DUF1100 family)